MSVHGAAPGSTPFIEKKGDLGEIKKGYLKNRLITALIDADLKGKERPQFDAENQKWVIGDKEIKLSDKFSSPHLILRIIHKIRLYFSSSYRAKFEKSAERVSQAFHANINPQQIKKTRPPLDLRADQDVDKENNGAQSKEASLRSSISSDEGVWMKGTPSEREKKNPDVAFGRARREANEAAKIQSSIAAQEMAKIKAHNQIPEEAFKFQERLLKNKLAALQEDISHSKETVVDPKSLDEEIVNLSNKTTATSELLDELKTLKGYYDDPTPAWMKYLLYFPSQCYEELKNKVGSSDLAHLESGTGVDILIKEQEIEQTKNDAMKKERELFRDINKRTLAQIAAFESEERKVQGDLARLNEEKNSRIQKETPLTRESFRGEEEGVGSHGQDTQDPEAAKEAPAPIVKKTEDSEADKKAKEFVEKQMAILEEIVSDENAMKLFPQIQDKIDEVFNAPEGARAQVIVSIAHESELTPVEKQLYTELMAVGGESFFARHLADALTLLLKGRVKSFEKNGSEITLKLKGGTGVMPGAEPNGVSCTIKNQMKVTLDPMKKMVSFKSGNPTYSYGSYATLSTLNAATVGDFLRTVTLKKGEKVIQDLNTKDFYVESEDGNSAFLAYHDSEIEVEGTSVKILERGLKVEGSLSRFASFAEAAMKTFKPDADFKGALNKVYRLNELQELYSNIQWPQK